MSDLIKHVLIGEVLGESLSIGSHPLLNNRYIAFTAGLSSQIIMDYIDNEYVVNWFNFNQINAEAVFYVFFQMVITTFIIFHIYKEKNKNPKKFKIKLYSITGAVLPDIIDGVYSLVKPQAWYHGDLIFFWHRSQEILPMQAIGATISISFSLFFFRFYIYPFLINYTSLSKYFHNNESK